MRATDAVTKNRYYTILIKIYPAWRKNENIFIKHFSLKNRKWVCVRATDAVTKNRYCTILIKIYPAVARSCLQKATSGG